MHSWGPTVIILPILVLAMEGVSYNGKNNQLINQEFRPAIYWGILKSGYNLRYIYEDVSDDLGLGRAGY